MKLVKIVDKAGTILGYIPPFPNLLGSDGQPAPFFELLVARKVPDQPVLEQPVALRLYIDRSGTEHITYRIYDNVAEVPYLPGFQPRPADAPG